MAKQYKSLPYVLFASLRSPDACNQEADCWKELVIAPLRWAVAILLNETPEKWCLGYRSMYDLLSTLKRHPESLVLTINKARKFADKAKLISTERYEDFWHVVLHAQSAWSSLYNITRNNSLLATVVDEYRNWLLETKLI